MPKTTISQFLNSHLWQIIVITVAGIVAFVWLQAEVKGLSMRVEAVEGCQAKYPSKDWFSLKFATIEEKIDLNTERLESF